MSTRALDAAGGRAVVQRRQPLLTDREREVLRLLADEVPTEEMASRLAVSPATVRNHLRRIVGKLGEWRPAREGRTADRQAAAGREGRTVVPGRLAGQRMLRNAVTSATRRGGTVSAVMLQFGAGEGAAERTGAVQSATHAAVEAVRATDWIGGWDGDALLVVLPGTGATGAKTAAERLRQKVGEQVPCFVGVVEWQTNESVDTLVGRLERSTYEDRVKRSVERTLWVRRTERP